MNDDKLKQGWNLKRWMENIEQALNAWEESEGADSLLILAQDGFAGQHSIPLKAWLDLRARVIEHLAAQLSNLKQEYERL